MAAVKKKKKKYYAYHHESDALIVCDTKKELKEVLDSDELIEEIDKKEYNRLKKQHDAIGHEETPLFQGKQNDNK